MAKKQQTTNIIGKINKTILFNEEDYLMFVNENLSPHMFIEFMFNKNNNIILWEQKTHGKRPEKLFEEYGVFNGCYDIARYIDLEIQNKRKEKECQFIVNLNDDTFTKTVTICFTTEVGYMAYYSPWSIFDKDTEKFKNINIFINSNLTEDNLIPGIMHELQHAYEDYRLRLKKDSLSLTQKRNGYEENNMKKQESKTSLDDILYYVFYFLYRWERNAHITELAGELKTNERFFLKISDVIEYIKNSQIYKNYYAMSELVDIICDFNDEIKQNYVLEYANQIYKNKFKSYAKFSKWLKNRATKCINKLNTIIPKIAYEIFNKKMNSNDIPKDKINLMEMFPEIAEGFKSNNRLRLNSEPVNKVLSLIDRIELL